jgi:hypothetical protein
MDTMSSRYEERLVELHSVIAELSRQAEERSRDRIAEEDDDDDASDADLRRRNDGCDAAVRRQNVEGDDQDAASRTSTDIDAQAVEVSSILRYT